MLASVQLIFGLSMHCKIVGIGFEVCFGHTKNEIFEALNIF